MISLTKGHHRHIEGVEELYAFVDVDRLLECAWQLVGGALATIF